MANRYFTQFFYSLLKKPVMIGGKISLASDASVSSSDLKGCTVAKTATGNYTITMADKYSKMFHASIVVADSAQDIVCDLKSISLSGQTAIIQSKIAGTVADVSDACDLYVTLILSNSSVD